LTSLSLDNIDTTKQKLIGSSLLWFQSHLFVGLNTHFPLLPFSSPFSRVSQKNENTQFTNCFINTH
jgi:hypothetical protein